MISNGTPADHPFWRREMLALRQSAGEDRTRLLGNMSAAIFDDCYMGVNLLLETEILTLI
jgi:hypothetical protein